MNLYKKKQVHISMRLPCKIDKSYILIENK